MELDSEGKRHTLWDTCMNDTLQTIRSEWIFLARGTVQPVGHNFLVRAVQVVQAYRSALRDSAIALPPSPGMLWKSRSSPVADRQAACRQGGRQAGGQASKQAGRQAGQTGKKASMSAQSQKN